MPFAATPQAEEQMVLDALQQGYYWVGPMRADELCQEDPSMPQDGRTVSPVLKRLLKKGLVKHEQYRGERSLCWSPTFPSKPMRQTYGGIGPGEVEG